MRMDEEVTIAVIIQKSLIEFNQIFKKEKVDFSINDDWMRYCLKPSKKNGMAKIDMPSIFYDLT